MEFNIETTKLESDASGRNIINESKETICTVAGHEHMEKYKKLIIAAPELLQACQEADIAFMALNLNDELTSLSRKALKDSWKKINIAMSAASGRPDFFKEANPELYTQIEIEGIQIVYPSGEPIRLDSKFDDLGIYTPESIPELLQYLKSENPTGPAVHTRKVKIIIQEA